MAGWAPAGDLPEALKAQNGLYKNYAPQAIAGKLLSEEEARLLTAISGKENQSPNIPLLAFLGYLQPVKYVPFGSISSPEKVSQTTYTDNGYGMAQTRGMRLGKCFAVTINGKDVRVYVFARHMGWPGLNSTCVILTTREDYLLDWVGNDQSDVFEECSLTDGILKITCARRQSGQTIYTYDVGPTSLGKRIAVEGVAPKEQ